MIFAEFIIWNAAILMLTALVSNKIPGDFFITSFGTYL